jgi:CRISPR-associated endonuclease Csn1
MKRLGLDLGSSSIGWFIREDEIIGENGVVTFQSGMKKGQGGYSSPTADRRTARSKRRLIQARKYRKWELLEVLLNEHAPLDKPELETWSKYKKGEVQKFPENEKFLKWLSCDFAYEAGIKYLNPYELRVKALDEKLSKHEFGRVLYHLIQRRGYKNIGETDAETKKQIDRRSEGGFQTALDNNRTIAEALTNNFLNKGERARNQYPYRDEYQSELELICKAQGYDISQNEKGEYKNEFVKKLYCAIIWQRPLRSQRGNIGKCTLETTKPRCPVSHPIFEIFRTWSFINTIKYYDDSDQKQNISPEFRKLLFEFFLKQSKNFKFEEIRKFLDKQFKSKKRYNYPYDKKNEIYDSTVAGMPVCDGLIDVMGNSIKEAISNIQKYNIGNAPKIISNYSLYDLWHILFESDETYLKGFAIEKLKIETKYNKKGEEYNPFAKLKQTIQTGYADLSIKAMVKIIPFLKDGFLYNEAATMAKIPELLGEKWELEKDKIYEYIKESNKTYNGHKTTMGIANNLIDNYKGLDYDELYACKDFTYELEDKHDSEILIACVGHFGEKSWNNRTDKNEIFNKVKKYYQEFLLDRKRAYREMPLLTDIFKEQLKKSNIVLDGELYHHSNKENIYGKSDVDKKTGLEILPEPRIDSIKNPMFNKSLSILRKLLNELIINGTVDKETEVVVEVARELNDNNKRAAIEKYQKFRRDNRENYRVFLNEFKEKENNSINVDESISTFELWTEQTFKEIGNEKKEIIKNKNNGEIHREKDALKRYELWMEQKGICMYTGKMISITQLFSNQIDIEHTIPRSLLPDNTMANRTVCYAWYNRDKKKKLLPTHCENYYENKEGWGTQIEARLDNWIEIRDGFKKQYEDRLKPKGNEDENIKNERIKNKHYYKMHFEYWQDKVSRFTADEVKDSWARRQLVDTQMISKYAREFLKTYFKKVAVQKGNVTADFRKIYGFQEQYEIKSRNRHSHHSIDAAVLTLIPTNSSHRDKLLKKMYETYENEKRQYTTVPFSGFNSQKLIQDIDSKTLIVNFEKDKILNQTSKIVRKRGKIQYLKNKNGKFILDKAGNKILKVAKGDTVRSPLFKDTFVAKIRDVERYEDGQPIKENDDWKYKKGKDEFAYVKRESIDKVKTNDNLIIEIVDRNIRKLVSEQKNNSNIKDFNGKIIRHVRIYTSAGREVKNRLNYKSQHEYKNKYYAASDSLPYAIMLQKIDASKKVERVMIPVASYEIAKFHKEEGRFNFNQFISRKHPEYEEYSDKKLLKVGQKVIVLKSDSEFEKRFDLVFQINRLYVIKKFGEDSIYLKYHIEATKDDDIDSQVKFKKDEIIAGYDKKFGLADIKEDLTIVNINARKKKYEDDRFKFVGLNDNRFKRLLPFISKDEINELRKEVGKYKKQNTKIEIDGATPLLKINKGEDWNFLYEGFDFELSLLGKINWLRYD